MNSELGIFRSLGNLWSNGSSGCHSTVNSALLDRGTGASWIKAQISLFPVFTSRLRRVLSERF